MVNDILSGIPGNFLKFYDWSCIFILNQYIKGFRAAIVLI
jgi:hypothetical protein